MEQYEYGKLYNGKFYQKRIIINYGLTNIT
jgi:hypothetical protein